MRSPGRLLPLLALFVVCLFSRALKAQNAITVAPDNGAHPDIYHRVANTNGHVVTFVVQANQNNAVDVNISVACTKTGNITITNCKLGGKHILVPGDTASADVQFNVGSSGTGMIQLTATSISPAGLTAVGKWDITIDSALATAKPADSVVNVPPATQKVAAFWIKNTGPVSETFQVDSICDVTVVSSCSWDAHTKILGPNVSDTVRVTYTTVSAGALGPVGVTVRLGPIVLATAQTQVLVPRDSVWPDGIVVTKSASSSQSFQFTVKNTGPSGLTFVYAPICTGSGIATSPLCTVTPAPAFLPGGASVVETINFTTTSSGTGTVGLKTSYAGITLDSGFVSVLVSTNAHPSASVLPQGLANGAFVTAPPLAPKTQVFTVKNLNTTGSQVTFSLTAICSGSGVQNACTSNPPATVPLGPLDSTNVTVGYTAGSEGFRGTVTVRALIAGQVVTEGYVNVNASATTVTPKDSAVFVAQSVSPINQTFQITNMGPAPITYSLQAHCLVAGLTGCSVTPSVNVAQSPVPVTVSYVPGTLGASGNVSLVAYVGGVAVDSGWIKVTVVQGGAAPIVDVVSVSPGLMNMQGHCLALAVGQGIASECGDVRIVHPLPAVRAMNVTRAPTLIYNSGTASICPLLPANVTLAASATTPTLTTATLTINSVTSGIGSWGGSGWVPGTTKRFAVGCNQLYNNLPTGVCSDPALDETLLT